MRKVHDGKKKRKEKKEKKIMLFLVATNVVASRLPERWATGTPHARANTSQMEMETHFFLSAAVDQFWNIYL